LKDCAALSNLSLSNIAFLPDDIEYCQRLESLYIHKGDMINLPEWILNLSKLRSLFVHGTNLKTLPRDWQKMLKLEHIDLSQNQIEDFTFLSTVANLERTGTHGNPIKDPLFMLEFSKALPISLDGDYAFKAVPSKEVPTFMSALGKSGLSRGDKEWFFYQFKDKKNLSIPIEWSLHRLMQGLCVPQKVLNANVTKRLEGYELNEKGIETFKKGAICYLSGSFTQQKTDIKQKLQHIGIDITTIFSEKVSHIIIGNRPKDAVEIYLKREIPFLFEHQLNPFIKDIGQEDKFLVQEAATGETQMVEGIKQLLGSSEAQSVLLGMEMLKAGGIPPTLLEELILLQKSFKDAKVRAEAKKLLEVHVSAEWVGILKDKQTFIDVPNTKGKEIRDKFEKMSKTVDKAHVHQLGMLFFKYFQKGVAFSLAHFKAGSSERIDVLNALTNGSYFDFHKGIGYHNWKNKQPDEIILSVVGTGIAFPSDHPNPLDIKVINMHNCKFDSVSKDIVLFSNLEELDLSVNNLKSLPLQMSKLKNLKRLNLSLNRMTEFPRVLEDLPSLEVLDIRYNDSNAFKSSETKLLKIPESFLEKLPNCTVLV
jgi:Leucine-rich repeat (LRR) protein